jgi:hypothetical protein
MGNGPADILLRLLAEAEFRQALARSTGEQVHPAAVSKGNGARWADWDQLAGAGDPALGVTSTCKQRVGCTRQGRRPAGLDQGSVSSNADALPRMCMHLPGYASPTHLTNRTGSDGFSSP